MTCVSCSGCFISRTTTSHVSDAWCNLEADGHHPYPSDLNHSSPCIEVVFFSCFYESFSPSSCLCAQQRRCVGIYCQALHMLTPAFCRACARGWTLTDARASHGHGSQTLPTGRLQREPWKLHLTMCNDIEMSLHVHKS